MARKGLTGGLLMATEASWATSWPARFGITVAVWLNDASTTARLDEGEGFGEGSDEVARGAAGFGKRAVWPHCGKGGRLQEKAEWQLEAWRWQG